MKKVALLSLFAVLGFTQLQAQDKLKTVQEGSTLAPAGVKVDGNLSDWKDSFQAYNKATKLYYTLANDGKYLYLITKSTDPTNIAKIQAGGINLIINTDDKKKDDGSYSLTYPVVNRPGRAARRGGLGGFGRNADLTDSAKKAMTAEAHKQLIDAAKEIKVTGFKDITDTLISIYNEYSIKAMVGFDEQDAITCEIAIPLSALGLSADNPKEFAYHVTLNGLPLPAGGGFGGGRGGRGSGGGRGGRGGVDINYQDLLTPTDFWGKYTLAKP